MPCYRCGARQTDPVRGPSPWKRGVRDGSQVLVCPDCQTAHDWTADMDRCPACGGSHLVRQLGDTLCRTCGWTGSPPSPAVATLATEPADDLATDVADAVQRVLRRPPR